MSDLHLVLVLHENRVRLISSALCLNTIATPSSSDARSMRESSTPTPVSLPVLSFAFLSFVRSADLSRRLFAVGSNPDSTHPVYSTPLGIYEKNCGLQNVMISWGHDEWIYHKCLKQSTLPRAALAMLRYHSFYPWSVPLLSFVRSTYGAASASDRSRVVRVFGLTRSAPCVYFHVTQAPRGRVPRPDGRDRPRGPQVCARVQPVRLVQQGTFT